MRTELCEQFGIDLPIFAFSHCRDVVAAVSKAGGLGVLGAVGFPPEQLEIELEWIDEHVGDRPYGVDIVIPGKYEGMGEIDPVKLEADLKAMIPQQHREFVEQILGDHGVPQLPEEEAPRELLGSKQALAHKEAGVDIVIAQGTEGGGHTGDVGSSVLWPEVIDAVAPTPVLAAGGIGNGRQMAAALALGAQGVWTGTLWLTLEEADIPPGQMETYLAAGSRDTVRSRSWTGKPCRMIRNDWTEAWEDPDNPKPLGMP